MFKFNIKVLGLPFQCHARLLFDFKKEIKKYQWSHSNLKFPLFSILQLKQKNISCQKTIKKKGQQNFRHNTGKACSRGEERITEIMAQYWQGLFKRRRKDNRKAECSDKTRLRRDNSNIFIRKEISAPNEKMACVINEENIRQRRFSASCLESHHLF